MDCTSSAYVCACVCVLCVSRIRVDSGVSSKRQEMDPHHPRKDASRKRRWENTTAPREGDGRSEEGVVLESLTQGIPVISLRKNFQRTPRCEDGDGGGQKNNTQFLQAVSPLPDFLFPSLSLPSGCPFGILLGGNHGFAATQMLLNDTQQTGGRRRRRKGQKK